MRKLAPFLLSIGIGVVSTLSVGNAIAYEPHCHAAYEKFWAKIHTPHHLDHKPSQAVLKRWKVYNDEMLRKLDFACEGIENEKGDLGNLPVINVDNGFLSGARPQSEDSGLAVEREVLEALIPEKGYPVYGTSSMDGYGNDSNRNIYWNYAGYFGLGGGYGIYSYPISLGPPVSNSPNPPIAPTPEPLPFALVMIGAAFIVVRRRK